MIKKITMLFHNIGLLLKNSIRRFTETILIATAMVIIGILLNHNVFNDDEAIARILLALGLGLVISADIVLFIERKAGLRKWRFVFDGVLAVLLAAFYFLLPKTLNQQFFLKYFSFILVLFLLFTMIPYFYKRSYYAVYCLNLLTSFFVTYLYTLVLCLGLIAMIFTVDQLFNLNMDGKIYGDLFMVATGIFGISYFLGGIPSFEKEITLEEYPKVFRVLFVSIIMPLLTAYTVILYAYFIKILIERDWPKGIVGNLVLWYGFISMIILFCIYEMEERPWIKNFKRVFPIGLAVPLYMLFTTIWIRTKEYGLTLPRYFVWISGIWFLLIGGYMIQKKWKNSSFIILSFMLFVLVSAFGPTSGYEMSFRSQNNRLEVLLKENDMLGEEGIQPNVNLPKDQQNEIASILSYMSSMEALNRLEYVPEGFRLSEIEEVFGFQYNYEPWINTGVEPFDYYYYNGNSAEMISQYDYIVNFDSHDYLGNTKIEEGDLEVALNLEQDQLTIKYKGSSIVNTSLSEIAVKIHQENAEEGGKDNMELRVQIPSESGKVDMVLYSLNGRIDSDGKVEIQNMKGQILIGEGK